MSGPASDPEPHMRDDDFAAILAAVMETGRGRWFLAEFARRNRHAETERVLAAIGRLESALVPGAPAAVPAAPPQTGTADALPQAPVVAAPALSDADILAAIDALSVDARLRMFR